MTDTDWVTLRIEHELDGVILEEPLPRETALHKCGKYARRLEWCDIGDSMLSARQGKYKLTIAIGVDHD